MVQERAQNIMAETVDGLERYGACGARRKLLNTVCCSEWNGERVKRNIDAAN